MITPEQHVGALMMPFTADLGPSCTRSVEGLDPSTPASSYSLVGDGLGSSAGGSSSGAFLSGEVISESSPGTCDQLTVSGYRCSWPASWMARDRRSAEDFHRQTSNNYRSERYV